MVRRISDAVWRYRAPLLLTGAATLAICVSAVVLAEWRGVPPSSLFKDAARSEIEGPLAGAVSVIGVMALVAAAAIAFFVAGLSRRERGLLLTIGVVSTVAALDDQFMLHESVPDWVPASNQVYVLVYGAILVAVIASVHRSRSTTALPLLFASGLFLGLSITMDVVKDTLGIAVGALTVVEDTLKLLGIAYWLSFTVLRGLEISRGATPSDDGEPVASRPNSAVRLP